MENIADYTEAEFVKFINQILLVNKGGTDAALGELLERFRQLAGHPDGTDLIFYPEPGADSSPEGVAQAVKAWRVAQRLPGFKED
ncbi:bacteriocin immunity protein [Pseudomonas sp. Marseille-Q1929]|uniref:bacteriocin immunity protein n=1 Tax=Pseudomonas sp. Marseille-Q1929 TaxID=2730402 RepID=UPI001A8FCCC0|nr:bacteriocin immunity protein [Pseudomonas sp. Marseille-Q1929]MBO0495582.1 bacteriocin immunity protein [Pseudomonas sp. Marseille-Q1929]